MVPRTRKQGRIADFSRHVERWKPLRASRPSMKNLRTEAQNLNTSHRNDRSQSTARNRLRLRDEKKEHPQEIAMVESGRG